ncbi:MAG: hypothetical protein ACRDPC_06150 [Solirubrobacteraceae bacterium]
MASEDGWALMEVVVSAAVVLLVVLGALAAMDAVSGTAGANKARTVAATLAEEDQERLRGMATADVDALALDPRVVNVAGVDYTIASRAEWVRDATGETVSCASAEGQSSYLRIRSTVTSPATGAAVKPIVLSSLVAPRAGASSQGTLSVKVSNAAGEPVMNLPVRATGPMARTEHTNEAGCAVFGLLDPGSYEVGLDFGGWVDKVGDPVPTQTAAVTIGNLSTLEFAYDKAASLNVDVRTRRLDGVVQPDPSTSILAANTGIPPSGFRLFAPAEAASSIQLTNLFPFPDGYKVYSGTCPGADPSSYDPEYFADHAGIVPVAPGLSSGTIVVLEPAVNLRVTRGGNQATAPAWSNSSGRARVTFYPTSPGCEDSPNLVFTALDDGALPEPGLPFGEYTVCAEDRRFDARRRRIVEGVQNYSPDGTPVIDMWLDTSDGGEEGPCP